MILPHASADSHHRRRYRVVLPLLCAVFAGTAPAAADQARFDRFADSPDHLGRAAAAALAADAAMPPACGERTVGERTAIEPPVAARFDTGAAQPTAGAWWERWQVRRCGQARMVNLHFVADAAGISVDVGIPGETLAQPVLQHGAVEVLTAFAEGTVAECPELAVVDSRVVDPPAGGVVAAPDAAWTERWTLMGCGGRDEVTIRFHPDQAASLFEIVGGG